MNSKQSSSASQSNSTVECKNSPQLNQSYKSAAMSSCSKVIKSGYREGPVSVKEIDCNTESHDRKSSIFYEADCLLVSGIGKKADTFNRTLRTLERQGGRGPLGHTDLSEVRQRLRTGKGLNNSYSSDCISIRLRFKRNVYPQPQLDMERLSAINCVRLWGADNKRSLLMQYVQKWALDKTAIHVAYGLLGGKGWDMVADSYSTVLVHLEELLGEDFSHKVAVIVNRRWVPRECRWTRTAAGWEPKPLKDSQEPYEQFAFTVVARDSASYDEVKNFFISSTAEVTTLLFGPHVTAWASSLDLVQRFSKQRGLSNMVVQHYKIESGEFDGKAVRQALERLKLHLPGQPRRPSLLKHVVFKTECIKVNNAGLFETSLNNNVTIVPIELSQLGETHVIKKLLSIVSPSIGLELVLKGTPISQLISELQGPCWAAPTTVWEPLSWEEFALLVAVKPAPSAPLPAIPCVVAQNSGDKSGNIQEFQERLARLSKEVHQLSSLLKGSVTVEPMQEKPYRPVYAKLVPPKVVQNTLLCNSEPRVTSAMCIGRAPSLTMNEAISSKPLKLSDHDTQLVTVGEFPPLNSADINTRDLHPDKTIPAGASVIKSDKGFFSKENGQKFFSSTPAKYKVPRNASHQASKVDIQQSTPVPAAEPRKHLNWDDNDKVIPTLSGDADISQIAALIASSEAEAPEKKGNGNILTGAVCQELSSQPLTKAISLAETPLLEPTNRANPSTSCSKPRNRGILESTIKTNASPLGICRDGNSASQRFEDSMFTEFPSANEIAESLDSTSASAPVNIYKSIVTSFSSSTLVAIAELIRIEVRDHLHREPRAMSILGNGLVWKDFGVEQWREILISIKSDEIIMLQVEIFNVLNASKIGGKLHWNKERGHEYSTSGLLDKLPLTIEIPSAKLSRLLKEKDEENKYAVYLSSLTELDCAAAYYFYSGKLYDSPGIRLDGSFESRVEKFRKLSDSSSTEEALLRIRPAFNQLYTKRKILVGRLVSSSIRGLHAYLHPDGKVFELPAGTKILPVEICRLLQQLQKDPKVADKSLEYPDAED